MSSLHKLVAKMRANRTNVRYDELVRVFRALGWREAAGGSGSHRRFDSPDGRTFVTVVRPHGGRQHVSPRAVDDVLATWDESGEGKNTDD